MCSAAGPWQVPPSPGRTSLPTSHKAVDFERERWSVVPSRRSLREEQPEVGCAEDIVGSSTYSEACQGSRIQTWTKQLKCLISFKHSEQ